MLVFEERGKPEYLEKNLSEQRREPTTNSTHIWRQREDLNPGLSGGRRVLCTTVASCCTGNNAFCMCFRFWLLTNDRILILSIVGWEHVNKLRLGWRMGDTSLFGLVQCVQGWLLDRLHFFAPPRELVLHKVLNYVSEKNSRLCTKTEVVFLNGAGIFKVANTAPSL